MGIDLLALPGHKALLGPSGTGALYVREGLDLQPLREGGTGSASERDEQPENYPDRLESGTLNTVGIAGLGAALEWLAETGVETIRRHEQRLTAALWEGLSAIPGITLHGPPPGEERAAVVSLTLQDWEPTDVAAVLDSEFGVQCRAGLHCAPWAHQALGTFPTGTVRFSPGFFNTEIEIETAIGAVRELAANSP
jgi:selenocysteine lyase/cysteine desulfurase